ncbi:MAG: cell wall hydrolase [Kiloniellales bacterium]|nr:cell wall hydrolase [Kiloniellales bacterium]
MNPKRARPNMVQSLVPRPIPSLVPRLAKARRRAALWCRRRLRRLGLPDRPGPAVWPWAIWAAVALLILVYIAQEHGLPQPAEGELADLDCLALNIYFEARNEDLEGKRAVGHVVMNRVRDAAFPATVCQVIRDGGERADGGCQFSWWCDGRSDTPLDNLAWRESREIAWDILRGTTRDPTRGALWYHADYVAPAWRTDFDGGRQIGRHIFYRRPN